VTKRKRTDEEQKLFDELEELRASRRGRTEALAAARAAFEALAPTADRTVISMQAVNYLNAIARLGEHDSKIIAAKAVYEALRKKNDSLS
jgi:hypothetical protein